VSPDCKLPAIPLFGQKRTIPPSWPKFAPPSREAAVKSLPSDGDPRGGRQAGATALHSGAKTRRPSGRSTAVIPSEGRKRSRKTTGVDEAASPSAVTATGASFARSF
jgi:hypothetical protein